MFSAPRIALGEYSKPIFYFLENKPAHEIVYWLNYIHHKSKARLERVCMV